jgi:hypothetical protein
MAKETPPDNAAASYGATWNAFKRIAAFSATAARPYKIDLEA